jgi:RimJ/RimL family protein N-acetyltransferase
MEERQFPEIIETNRLVLRRYSVDDAGGLLELIDRNRQELIRDFAQTAALQGVQQVESFIAARSEQWQLRKNFTYGVWQKGADALVGQVQVKNIGWEIPAAELSYFIDKNSQRQGFASESVRGIVTVAFEELRFERIFLRILPSNSGSLSLAKRLGFQEEGLHRRAFRCGFGELHDVYLLSLITQDYFPGKELRAID